MNTHQLKVTGLSKAAESINAYVTAGTRKITEIIVHCSAPPEGRDVRCADIRRWHTSERGFADIGYHFVVTLDGTIECGRPLPKAGAHCIGHNRHSIGICYVGGLDRNGKATDTRTPAQRTALKALINTIAGKFQGIQVHGHRDFAAKDCPCFNATAEYSSLTPPEKHLHLLNL